MSKPYNAIIIGSGPNGLSAGIELLNRGHSVLIVEAGDTVGGGMRTKELTLPNFHHDICSAVHPMGYLSPVFRKLELEKYGLEWIFPTASVAHPLDDEPAVLLSKSVAETAANLGVDQRAYESLMRPFVKGNNSEKLFADLLKPLGIPQHPFLMTRFGIKALLPATTLARFLFKGTRAKALFAGCTGHSVLPFDKLFTSALGLVFLLSAHNVDWPIAKGGSQAIADALAKLFQAKGGEIQLNTRVENLQQLPPAQRYFFDTDPLQMAKIAATELPHSYIKRLQKFHFGPGVFKIDYALNASIPWKDSNCLKASTVHLGGTFAAIAQSEKDAWEGKHSDKPYVLLTQQSQFDPTRAPAGQHTCWAYCHVPFGSTKDMSNIIENQIERFAPGFKDTIIAKSSMNTAAFERYNPNYIGGAVTGGAADITQLFTRPVARYNPYSTPNPKIYICSAATPPGGGVHGLCGYYAVDGMKKI